MKGFRVVSLTVLWAGVGMGVGLFCGIIGVLVLSVVQQRALDLSLAYRNIATPIAILVGGCAFLWNAFRMMQETARRARARKA
jgi:zinc transporter ZupT